MKSPAEKKRQRLLALGVCLLAPVESAGAVSKNNTLSAKVERAGYSVWKLQATLLYPEGKDAEIYGGSGFFVRPDFEEKPDGHTGENSNLSHYLVTGFHIAHKILKDGAPPESISIVPPPFTKYNTLTVDKLAAVDGTADLALLRVKGEGPAPLAIRESLSGDEEDLFALGWPGGVFHVMKKTGLLASLQNHQYFPVDFFDLEGGSGGPVTDREGRVIGVAYSSIDNFLFSTKGDSLQDFLRGERGIHCGNATSRDCLKQAETKLQKAAEAGDSVALFILSRLYSNGGIRVAKNTKKAFELMKSLAGKGNPSAQREIAYKCRYGVGVKENLPCTVNYAKKSAEQEFAPGLFFLAGLYTDGVGVEKNDQIAFELTLSAAENGLSSAQHNAGLRYFSGTGVERNLPQAISWIKKAAEGRFAPAKHLLGHLHYKGLGVKKDIPLSVSLWTEAMWRGDKDARFSLALLLHTEEAEEEGDPQQNTSLALRHINFLADRDYFPAKEFLSRQP